MSTQACGSCARRAWRGRRRGSVSGGDGSKHPCYPRCVHGSDKHSPWPEVADEAEERERWRRASPREKGDALIDLLGLVDAIGRYPEPRTRWPGFPNPREGHVRRGR